MNVTHVRITSRDIELFDLLERYRWLTREQISYTLNWNFKSVERRCLKLVSSGYIDARQLSPSHPIHHALGNEGARELSVRRDISIDKLYWKWRNRHFASGNIEHASLTASPLLKLIAENKDDSHYRTIQQREIFDRLSSERKRLQHPFSISVDLTYDQNRYTKIVNPDQVFGIHNVAAKTASWFSLEADRGHHPEKRADFSNHRQIFPKLVAFYEIYRRGLFKPELNLQNMRQLWLVATKDRRGTSKRIQNMQEIALEATDGNKPDLFLFASAYELEEHGSICDFEFKDATRDKVYITA